MRTTDESGRWPACCTDGPSLASQDSRRDNNQTPTQPIATFSNNYPRTVAHTRCLLSRNEQHRTQNKIERQQPDQTPVSGLPQVMPHQPQFPHHLPACRLEDSERGETAQRASYTTPFPPECTSCYGYDRTQVSSPQQAAIAHWLASHKESSSTLLAEELSDD